MTKEHRDSSLRYWNDTHKSQNYDRGSIRTDDWLERFNDIIMRSESACSGCV